MRYANSNTPVVSEYMTPPELSALTGMKLQTLAAWRCRGGGPPFTRIGASIRYSRTSVEKWLTARTGTSTTQLEAAFA